MRILLVSASLALAALPTRAEAQAPFACTEVLGFSQSMEWYGGFSIVGSRGGQDPLELDPIRLQGPVGGPQGGASGPPGSGIRVGGNGGVGNGGGGARGGGNRGGGRGSAAVVSGPDATLRAAGEFLPGWQGRFTLGATIERWLDPAYLGWSGEFVTELVCDATAVDRVVFNVSAFGRWLESLGTTIPTVVEMIRTRYPSVREIVLQPIVGAPPGECLQVRDAANHPLVAAAVQRAVGGLVRAGPPPIVRNCSHFRDDIGHLTPVGAQALRQELREYYR